MKRVVAVLAVAGLLALAIGCQPPAQMADKVNSMEKDIAELKASVEKLTEAMDKLSQDFDELAKSYAEHVEKHHKGTTYTPPPAPVKKRTK